MKLNKNIVKKVNSPVRIVQFGEGNFLRAFADYFIDLANENGSYHGSIVVVKPIAWGNLDTLRSQDHLYTVSLKGLQSNTLYEETRVITSIDSSIDVIEEYNSFIALAEMESLEVVISNTTEAGIQISKEDKRDAIPAVSFPAKLTQFLYHRARSFNYDYSKGLIVLPVELIDQNGDCLKECITTLAKDWLLEPAFLQWIEEACYFSNTLVDRIVTGRPNLEHTQNKLGYEDELLVEAEPFGLWVIQSDGRVEEKLPIHLGLENKKNMDVIFVDDVTPYKQRKVRVLNGAHTGFALLSFLKGNNTVLESIQDPIIERFIHNLLEIEVIPNCTLSEQALYKFKSDVMERFANPAIAHALLSISLNSVSKWKTRCYPSMKACIENQQTPNYFYASLVGLLHFYAINYMKDGQYFALRNGQAYEVKDDLEVLQFFLEKKSTSPYELIQAFLKTFEFDCIPQEDVMYLVDLYQLVTNHGVDAMLSYIYGK